MYYNMEKCGARIRQLRKQRGYTQESLAVDLNVDRSVLSRIEAGKYACSVEFIAQLATFFGVTLDFLVFGKVQNVETKRMKETVADLIRQLEQFKEVI